MSNQATIQYTLSSQFTRPKGQAPAMVNDDGLQVALGSPAPDWIRLDASQQPATVVVNAPNDGKGKRQVTLKLTLTDGGAQAVPLYIVGIALSNTGANPRSQDAFPASKVDGYTLELTDDDVSTTLYDFVLLFQDANGNIGILDPRIQNT